MKPPVDLARLSAVLSAFVGLNALTPDARATVTYTYTGPSFETFEVGDPDHLVSAGRLVASFVFDAPLAASLGSTDTYALATPLSWSISGGGYTLNSTDTGAALNLGPGGGIMVYTDATGALRGWDYLAYVQDGLDDTGPRFRSFYYPTGPGLTNGAPMKYDGAFYWNLPTGVSAGYTIALGGGSWAVSAVPEPGSQALWLAGAGVLGWMLRQRRRAWAGLQA